MTENSAGVGPVEPTVRPPLQGGLSNAELLTAWMRKVPRVEPSERDLSAFALGVEVGRELGLQAAAQAAQPDDSYQDEWFKAKADAVRRIRALLPPAAERSRKAAAVGCQLVQVVRLWPERVNLRSDDEKQQRQPTGCGSTGDGCGLARSGGA